MKKKNKSAPNYVAACCQNFRSGALALREMPTSCSDSEGDARASGCSPPPLPSSPAPPQPEVMHIQPEPRVEANNKVLTAYIEGGEATETPMRSAGLTGAGQVIGVTDTGLDDSSCFFKDDVNGLVPRCVRRTKRSLRPLG